MHCSKNSYNTGLQDQEAYSAIHFLQPIHRPNSLHVHVLRQNAYMHEQITKEFTWGKYLNECTPFGYVSLWILSLLQASYMYMQFNGHFH